MMKDNMLEVGDELFTVGTWNSDMFYAGRIDRVTATCAFMGSIKVRRKYDFCTKRPGDSSYSGAVYYLLGDESRAKLSEQQKRRGLLKPLVSMVDMGRQGLARLSNDQLERINAILAEREKE